MTLLVGCTPDEALGYPGYFRAVYRRGRIDPTLQLASVVAGVADKMRSSSVAVPINQPTPVEGDWVAVLDVRVSAESARRTVSELAGELSVAPLWGLPLVPAAVDFVSLERITQAKAYDAEDRNTEREKQNDAAQRDTFGMLTAALKVLAAVILAAVLVVVVVRVARVGRR